MAQKLLKEETPLEFFREQLVKAMEHQRVSTSAFTEFYLVNLLAECVSCSALPAREPGFDELPLALLYARALQCPRAERIRMMRAVGDSALFLSGFFEPHLCRRLGDPGPAYYHRLGGAAYGHVSDGGSDVPLSCGVFVELAQRFGEFADLFSEVSEQSRVATPSGVLQLYERWLATGSRRCARLLADHGVTPVNPTSTGPQ